MSTVTTPTLPDPIEADEELSPLIGLADNGRLMTPEEFDAIEDYDENYSYELIHGVLVVNAPPGPAETDPNDELGHLLRVYSEQHPGIINRTIFESYVRTPNGRRRADRVVWIGLDHRPNVKTDVPTIAIEFLSAGTRSRKRDYIEKRAEYLQIGVREYWLFDRFHNQLIVFKPDGDVVVTSEYDYTTPRLPGFVLPVKRILALANEWVELDDEKPHQANQS